MSTLFHVLGIVAAIAALATIVSIRYDDASVRRQRRLGALGLIVIALVFISLGVLSEETPQDYTEIEQQLSVEFNVPESNIEVLNVVPLGCLKYTCISWKGVVFVNDERKGIVEFSSENYIFTPDP